MGRMRIISIVTSIVMVAASLGAAPNNAAPAREPAPMIPNTGRLRVAHYTQPFAPSTSSGSSTYYENRYVYGTPGYGCYGYYGYFGYCGWRYCGYGFGCYSSNPTTGVAPSAAYAPGW
jgi:hypothetical protein